MSENNFVNNPDNAKPKRANAGVNNSLDTCYLWPPFFGEFTTRVSKMPEKNGDENQIDSDKVPLLADKYDKQEITSVRSSVISRKSSSSSIELQRKTHALEIAKIKQAIEMKKLENQLQLMELEQEVFETQIPENSDRRSSKSVASSRPNKVPNNTLNSIGITEDIPGVKVRFEEKVEDIPKRQSDLSEVQQLCNTISDAIKTVANGQKNDRFIARQVVERDIPFYDGNPEEWPTFITQFRKISSLCQYSPEEMMIKLNKCLKGEAKLAVSGMMISPENLSCVLKTLEMRFGRPDLIIDGLISKVKAVPPIKENNIDSLIRFSNHVTCLVATIKSLGFNEHLQNPILLRDIVQKLPDMIKLRWGEEIMKRHGTTIDLGDLSEWISDIATAACYVTMPSTSRVQKYDSRPKFTSNHQSKRFESTFTTADCEKKDVCCTYCGVKGHSPGGCSKIKQDDVEIRWKTATERKLCFSCLRSNHQTMKCRFKRQCGIDNCRRSHHKLLHKDQQHQTIEQVNSTQTDDLRNENVLAVGQGAANVLLRMIKVKLYGRNTVLETIALCDEASTVSLIDKSIADQLDSEGRKESLCIQWTNNLTSCYENSHCLNLNISGVYPEARKFSMKNVRSIENLSLPFQVIKQHDWNKYPHLDGIPFDEIQGRPMILLGQDNIRLTVARKVIQGQENTPIATKTNLGWILHGDTTDEDTESKKCYSFHLCHCKVASDYELHKLVKESFTIDAFGVQIPTKLSKKDNRALDIMKRTAKRIEDRFEVGLLWKDDDIRLPESKTVAIGRLGCIERQMQKDPNFRQKYCDKIDSYVKKGYATKLSVEEAAIENPRCWYLPHFGVMNPNKPNKLRIVFDAASKSGGMSLNDNLLAGPDLLQPLVEVLMKFRQRKIAFCSDVQEMFHQVRIITSDQPSQRFIWRDGNLHKPYNTYEMKVMTFGATCSPICAQFVKNLNAQQLTQREEILNAILKKHYVDDYLDCTNTVEEALEIISEVKRIQKLGGFDLVDWTSNSPEIMKAFATDRNKISKNLDLESNTDIQRVLGLSWNSKSDTLCFKLQLDKLKVENVTRVTKRHILKLVMSIFDPLGLIVNLTIRGRILIQDIWKTGIGWDDVIDEELYQTWKLWLTDLEQISTISIPRCYSLNIPFAKRIELHIFCDGGKKAFASVAYLRTITRDTIDVSLVFARARVAPNKPISIPRLELQAAVMGARMMTTIVKTLEFHTDRIFLWSDSTTVLFWIKSDGSRLGQFEAHRVGEIQEITDSSNWHWIPTKLNAADDATRTYSDGGNNSIQFARWYTGPEFLYISDETKWPIKKIDIENISNSEFPEPEEFVGIVVGNDPCLPQFQRFSKWLRLIRSAAWVLKIGKYFISRLRNRNCSPILKELTVPEIQEAENRCIRQCQLESFPDEIHLLNKNKPLPNPSRLKQLSPTLDENGLLVLCGRTDLAVGMEPRTRRPIILPPKHRLTKLLLHHYHEKCGHQGIETVLNMVRQKFWVIDGRTAVKNVFAECTKCRILKAKPQIPEMGQIPPFRLTPPTRAFTYTGVDYFGPLHVSVERRREKRWGVIFTCLSVRAVHLEVAYSLTTDSAIMAVKRMMARRGQPSLIYSDNGTNFRGSSEELKRAIKDLDKEKLRETMSEKNIEWKFIPASSPHMGGAWERLVRSVKNTFNAILNQQVLRDELLLTIFTECENIINSRPITKVSVDPNDPEALTPNHFLLGTTNEISAFYQSNGNLRNQWRRVQILKDAFWQRWTKEYLPTLTKRTKWRDNSRPIRIDDVVVIIEENAPRRSWKLGKVDKLFPGPDDKIRVVQVKTANGCYKRPVAKLCRLNIEESERS